MRKGEFVEIADAKQPWAPWQIWVEYDWLDYRHMELRSKAIEILQSGWISKKKAIQ